VHPLLALPLAMIVATLILGGFTAIKSLRNVPEGYEDEEGFWALDEKDSLDANDQFAEPARIRVEAPARLRE
jgi:hypothetical protein